MFIGRRQELADLERQYNSNKFEFVVIYGRRRVGKTALIKEFIHNKKAIYFMGLENSQQQNLENFSRNIYYYKYHNFEDVTYKSYQVALEEIFKLAEHERIILAIDEYPYIARGDISLPSTLQLLIDKYKDSSKLMLILCGSSMSYMVDQVLAYKSPLFGRRTGQIKLQPFSFSETSEYFKNYSKEDKALAYGIVGGTPQYILQFDSDKSIAENIKNTFLNPRSLLFEEPENLLKQEVRDPVLYNAIITTIANGASRMTDIATKVKESTSTCTPYLKNLIELGLIKKETPYGDDSNRKAIYTIAENMFRFWYRFVPQNSSLIAIGGSEFVYTRIAPFLNEYMGKIFEEICKQYLFQELIHGNCPVLFSQLGGWWGNNPQTKKQEEIDIMGQEDKNTALFAECKWTNEKIDVAILNTLEERSRLFHYSRVYLYLFAKRGFTNSCIEKAQSMGNVKLVCYDEML